MCLPPGRRYQLAGDIVDVCKQNLKADELAGVNTIRPSADSRRSIKSPTDYNFELRNPAAAARRRRTEKLLSDATVAAVQMRVSDITRYPEVALDTDPPPPPHTTRKSDQDENKPARRPKNRPLYGRGAVKSPPSSAAGARIADNRTVKQLCNR
ncbi:hypothetical protein EVAR_75980_1 [Eumeta japonica]|uniref:Uncharacterized protein n=1 Tax=Eumeta variegata TaxID=151549 RepID=A0A4C1UB00_EUMVA|nr:hypothetical protein EVAR_75980_1 [Eumeta japonica]